MAMKGVGSGVIYTDDPKKGGGMRWENPFTLKVAQVFTGFGIGCGVGIGVGRPLNLGAIPVLNQVMIAASGATDAFSGVQRHVNHSLRKVGAKNIEAGIGCGVGFGHGLGVGLAVKPSVLRQIQSQAAQIAIQMMKKLGMDSISPSSFNQGILPSYSEETLTPKSTASNTLSSRTETVFNNFLKNPILQEEGSSLHEKAGSQELENNVLRMVLKHQLLIDELMQENEKLRQILVEDLKVQPSKLQYTLVSRSKPSCAECFECRRKQRRR